MAEFTGSSVMLRAQFGEAARRTVAERYTAGAALPELAAAYRRLTGRPVGDAPAYRVSTA